MFFLCLLCTVFFYLFGAHLVLHLLSLSFPTLRSSVLFILSGRYRRHSLRRSRIYETASRVRETDWSVPGATALCSRHRDYADYHGTAGQLRRMEDDDRSGLRAGIQYGEARRL